MDTCSSLQPLPGNGIGPTYYGPNKTAVGLDLWIISVTVACATIALAGLFTIFSFETKADAVRKTFGLLFGLYVMFTLLLCNFSYNWQYGEVQTRTPYAGYDPHEVDVTLGIKIGLRGFNVTMHGEPEYQLGQRIDYNEQFLWGKGDVWFQGRGGFSDLANTVARRWRRAQFGGMPLPILQIAEYFLLDGEQIRWLRYYRYAGYYTHIAMYTGLGVYFVSVLFGAFRPRVGALLLMLVAALMATAVIIYASVVGRIKNPLVIPWRDGALSVSYSWAFILTAATSGVLFFVAVLLYLHHTAQSVRRRRVREEHCHLSKVEVWISDHLGGILELVFGRSESSGRRGQRARELEVSCLCGTCDDDECECLCHDGTEKLAWSTSYEAKAKAKAKLQTQDAVDSTDMGTDSSVSPVLGNLTDPTGLNVDPVADGKNKAPPAVPPPQTMRSSPQPPPGQAFSSGNIETVEGVTPPPTSSTRLERNVTWLEAPGKNAPPQTETMPPPLS